MRQILEALWQLQESVPFDIEYDFKQRRIIITKGNTKGNTQNVNIIDTDKNK